jgi:hypothetical protein
VEPLTVVVYGRYWYDATTILGVVAFFLVEMVLLFRNSLLGWAMTLKCLMLSVVFSYAFLNPPTILQPEDISLGAALIRVSLLGVLGLVIIILVVMRWRRETVIVGREGALPGAAEAVVRDQAASDREDAVEVREGLAFGRERDATGREGTVATREGDATVREVSIHDRERNRP